MTFRFDRITYYDPAKFRAPLGGSWRIEFKGVEGRGVYGALISTAEGLVLEEDIDTDRRLLLPGFTITDNVETPNAISRRLATELHRLDWGPEVSQAGSIVDSSTYEFQPGR